MNDQRKHAPILLVVLLTGMGGFAALTNEASSPRFATFHGIDVVRLITAGFCFGVAVVGLVMLFVPRGGRSS